MKFVTVVMVVMVVMKFVTVVMVVMKLVMVVMVCDADFSLKTLQTSLQPLQISLQSIISHEKRKNQENDNGMSTKFNLTLE